MDEVSRVRPPRGAATCTCSAAAIVAVVVSGVACWPTPSRSDRPRSASVWPWARSHRASAGMIFADGMRLALIGIVPGILGAYGAARGMSALLFGVAPGDPATFAAAVGLVLVMTFAGSLAPGVSGFADYADVDPESRVVGLHSRSTGRPARRSTAAIASRMTSSRKRRPTSWTPAGRSSTKSIGTTPAGRPR